MELISNLAVPITIALIVLFGIVKKQPVFDLFTEGVKNGISSTIMIAPSIIALVTAVTILRQSGAMELLCKFLSPITDAMDIHSDIVALGLMRPISGSGGTAILNDILINHGPDSLCGRIASVISGSTETTFYAIAVYYGSVGIRNTSYTVPAALCADIVGMVIACLVIK